MTSDFRDRLRQRADPIGVALTPSQVDQLERYYDLLSDWNQTINLTALPLYGSPDRTLDRLFIEPLQAAAFVEDVPAVWFDLGTGSGSPAIPLKVARPRLELTMVESRTRKAAFLGEVVRALGLKHTAVRNTRIEALPDAGFRGKLDLVTIRAVRIDQALIGSVTTLLRPGGRLFLFGSAEALKSPGLERIAGHLDGPHGAALRIFSRADCPN